MRPSLLPVLAAALLPLLNSCTLGANIAANTPLERQLNGTYEGVGLGGTGRVPYRLILYVQEREGRASGVITNLESRKAYALSGSFKRAGTGGILDANLYEDGDKLRGTLRGDLGSNPGGKTFSGTLRTVLLGKELLGYVVTLNKVETAPQAAPPAPTMTPPAVTAPTVTPLPTPGAP